MKFKLFLLTGLLFIFSSKSFSQNSINFEAIEVNYNTEFDLPILLDNTENIAAIQFDININSDAFELLSGHLLSDRASSHSLGVSSPSQGVVRVIIYSTDNTILDGNSGELVRLKLKSKTDIGNFSISFTNLVMSDQTGNAITGSSQGSTIKVLAPMLNLVTKQVDFGRVPLGANPAQTITVQNLGNSPLILTSHNLTTPFSIQESFPITISANSTANLTLLIDSSTKYDSSTELSFQNNDPDLVRKIQKVSIKANVYAVNEIKVGSGTGIINSEITIPVVIDNMEPFTGFQFDITLPTGFSYVTNSITKSARFNDQSISANLIDGNKIRFLAFSNSNTDFNGDSGEVFSFKLKPSISSGSYPLVISNAIISNTTLGNTLSDIYNGSIQLNSANLVISPSSIDLGEVPLTGNKETIVRLSNTGNAILTISELVFSATEISWDVQLPLEIGIGAFKDVNMTFTPSVSGNFSETVLFKYNEGTSQKSLPISANVYSPNFIMVKNQEVYRNTTGQFQILLKNNDPVRSVQFDVELPSGFVMDFNTIALTDRTSGFTVSASQLTDFTYRIILYSTSALNLNKGNESILSLPIYIANDKALGTYSFIFSDVIISDINNQNINSTALENGEIVILDNIRLKPKIFLQGPLMSPTTSGLMNDNLRLSDLPNTSPYNDAMEAGNNVFNTGGSSGSGQLKDDVVDWIWVELRDESLSSTIVASKSALVQRDGDVVDVDGISSVSFNEKAGNYFVVIKHRNHLDIMSATAVNLTSSPIILDFTNDVSKTYNGTNALINIDGKFCLVSGDYDNNGQIQNSDIIDIVLLLGSSGYSNADLDMNGQVQNTDINNLISPNLGKGVQF